jgi:hypothetical protein
LRRRFDIIGFSVRHGDDYHPGNTRFVTPNSNPTQHSGPRRPLPPLMCDILKIVLTACAGYYCRGSYDEHDRERTREMNVQVHRDPQPIPRSRSRALTLPLPETFKTKHLHWPKQTTLDQSQSLLLSKLPLEVRSHIYKMVLGRFELLQIISSDGRLAHYACAIPGAKGTNTFSHTCWFSSQGVGLLSLLKSCRQV